MNKKQQPFFNPELSGFCSQMAMILHSGISPLEGITIMLEDSTSDREKDIHSSKSWIPCRKPQIFLFP